MGALVAAPSVSHAGGAWLGSNLVPVEQRVAIAVGPDRTTLWTSLRVDGPPGPVGFVLPVDPGAALDLSSDAWFEALEIATAPRVSPPPNGASVCPGETAEAHPMHSTADVGHTASLVPGGVVVLADAAAVSSWAAAYGLVVPADVAATMSSLAGKRFLAAVFDAPVGKSLTPTFRVATPNGAPLLPLALTHAAAAEPLLVTVFMVGQGRGKLAGATDVSPLEIAWNAADGTTDYAAVRLSALAQAPGSALTEAAGHQSLSHDVAIAGGTATIDGVLGSYVERAIAYAGASDDVATCIATGAAALASSAPVAPSCPRADLGVVDGTDTCVESPVSGQTDPAVLRCGAIADDLAVGLSGSVPADAWLTRQSIAIAASQVGVWATVTFDGGPAITPLLDSSAVDLGDCDGTGGAGGGGVDFDDDPGTGSGSGSSGTVPGGGGSDVIVSDDGGSVYVDTGCSCSGTAGDGGDWDDGSDTVEVEGDDTDVEVEEDTSDSSSDDCEGDTAEEADTSSDDCEGDTSDGSSSSSSDDCSGETSSSSSGDDCGGDASSSSSSDSCDSGGSSSSSGSCDSGGGTSSSSDCSIASAQNPRHRARGPRLSALTLGGLAFLLPLRRAMRRRKVER